MSHALQRVGSMPLFDPPHGLSLGHAEDGQLQAPPNGKQPERNHHNHAGPKRPRTLQPKRLQEQVESDAHDCGRGVEVAPQDEGHLRREDIPQDSSGYTGHRAHQYHDDRWALRRFCHLGSGQRKQRQSEGVGHEERVPWRGPYPHITDGQQS